MASKDDYEQVGGWVGAGVRGRSEASGVVRQQWVVYSLRGVGFRWRAGEKISGSRWGNVVA